MENYIFDKDANVIIKQSEMDRWTIENLKQQRDELENHRQVLLTQINRINDLIDQAKAAGLKEAQIAEE